MQARVLDSSSGIDGDRERSECCDRADGMAGQSNVKHLSRLLRHRGQLSHGRT